MAQKSEEEKQKSVIEIFKQETSNIVSVMTGDEVKVIARVLMDKGYLLPEEFKRICHKENTENDAAGQLVDIVKTKKRFAMTVDFLSKLKDSQPELVKKIMPEDIEVMQLAQNTPSSDIVTAPSNVQLIVGTTQAQRAEKKEKVYDMPFSPHGRCIIINNVDFRRSCPLRCWCLDDSHTRHGSNYDAYRLKNTFRTLDYKIKYFENLTAEEIEKLLKKQAKKDHSNYDSFICCILSHGDEGAISGVDWNQVSIDKMVQLFESDKCRDLADKPKMFFIQACRGTKEDYGVVVARNAADGGPGGRSSIVEGTWLKRIPVQSDFIISYACAFGNVCYRQEDTGSYYIQTLCDVLAENYESDDLESMLTKVTDMVKNTDIDKNSKIFKQIPDRNSRLSGKVYFRRQ